MRSGTQKKLISKCSYEPDCDDEECSDTTDSDLGLFKAVCRHWINEFGLYDIRFEFCIKETEDNIAQCWMVHGARTIWVELSDNLPVKDREKLISETAFHEIFEAGVLGRMIIMAGARNMDEEAFESECHAVVFRMQNVLNVESLDYKQILKKQRV